MTRAKSIYTLIKGLSEPEWNYYEEMPDNKSLAKPFVTDKNAKEFIKDFFTKGGKDLVTERFRLQDFGIPRAEHTVSIYFLGILLYHNSSFYDKIFYDGKINTRFDFFSFIWFITCLSHDFAFYQERDESLCASMPDINALLKLKAIQYNLLEQEIANVPKDFFQLIPHYYNMRHSDARTDHGIHGGLIAYDVLVDNRKQRKQMNNIEWLWEEYLDKEYAYAAATVAIHNMWLPGEADSEKYILHGLAALIGRKEVAFSEAPLLYLLGLVDTLDPVKAYGKDGIAAEFILRNTYLKFLSPTRFEITVSSKLKPGVLHNQGASLTTWLDVIVTPIKRGVQVNLRL